MTKKIRFAALFVSSLTTLSTLWPATAEAQPRRGGHARGAVVVVGGGYLYDPFFGPWLYPYSYQFGIPYPYGAYRYAEPESNVRVDVTPREAAVYVDGYYAGTVDEFDGVFQRLRVRPGEHEIVVYLEGYRSIREQLYLGPNSTRKIHQTMERLAPGEPSQAPPVPSEAARSPGPPPQGPIPQRGSQPPDRQPERRAPPQASRFGTLAIRVQPGDAEVLIDGERWRGPDGDERLIVQVSEGRHHVEVQKDGYLRFSTDVQVRLGETAPLNVSLAPNRPE